MPNGIIGDAERPYDVPKTQLPKEAPKRSNGRTITINVQELEDYVRGQIMLYQNRIPTGNGTAAELEQMPAAELGARWLVANTAIKEVIAMQNFFLGEDSERKSA